MKLKISRQHADAISSQFMPHILVLHDARLRETVNNPNEQLINKILKSILCDLDIMFKRRMLTKTRVFTIDFSDAQGIVFYMCMLSFPVPSHQIYLHNLRNQVVQELHKQII